jgi:hypothetical protein
LYCFFPFTFSFSFYFFISPLPYPPRLLHPHPFASHPSLAHDASHPSPTPSSRCPSPRRRSPPLPTPAASHLPLASLVPPSSCPSRPWRRPGQSSLSSAPSSASCCHQAPSGSAPRHQRARRLALHRPWEDAARRGHRSPSSSWGRPRQTALGGQRRKGAV